jgi:hypothetical protein
MDTADQSKLQPKRKPKALTGAVGGLVGLRLDKDELDDERLGVSE